MPEMTPEAMHALSSSVRKLRVLLEEDLSRQLDRRFRLAVPASQAGLREKERAQRYRLEQWLDERVRARRQHAAGSDAEVLATVRESLVSEMASQSLLRVFLLRQLEACGLSRPVVLAGGWSSTGYLEFRSHAPGLTDSQSDSEYEGLDLLLKTLFDELAVDLPGLYEQRPLDASFRLSAAALREVVSVLNAPELESAWHDDTTLGWVYQFWNDPRREAIDQRVGPRGKIHAQEIASKTQLFTERYMVEWLLQNSVGRIALSMPGLRDGQADVAAPPGWTMFVAAAGEMAPEGLPACLAELRILDPACGSGHFLAGAFDLLVPLYRKEAAAAGKELSDREIADSIIRNNLHGVDIDARAVQVAAAVLYLKARRLSASGGNGAEPAVVPPMNLVATAIDLDGLPPDDPALAALAAGLPGGKQDVARVIADLRHVSVRGSLMRFSRAEAQVGLFEDMNAHVTRFISAHASDDDLGVRFDGPQLSAGLRLRSLLVEKKYDVVLFNPPYLATSKIDLPPEVLAEAFGDSPDLFAAFVQRALELCKPTGLIAFVALSNWMFLSTFQGTRERVLEGKLLLLADVGKGAFRWASKLIQSAMVIAAPTPEAGGLSLGARVGSRDAISANQTDEISSELRDASSYKPFDPATFGSVEGAPLLFWLEPEFLRRYAALPKVAAVADCSGGIATTNNERFLRAVWELPVQQARAATEGRVDCAHRPYIKGAEGRCWLEPYRWVIRTARDGLELRELLPNIRPEVPGKLGVAYTTIGHRFGLRLHTVPSVRDVSGASVFPRDPVQGESRPLPGVETIVCALNRTPVRELAAALNPTVNFQLGDVRRLPFDPVENDTQIVETLRNAFAQDEHANELSVDFRKPGGSAWQEAQEWAQTAVDRRPDAPLEAAALPVNEPAPFAWVSFAVGVALGRFGADGEGLMEQAPETSLPGGILFLGADGRDSLEHAACELLRLAWDQHGSALGGRGDLGTYLRKSFFAEHNRLYDKRPIYLPLSSAKKTYVAFLAVHRWQEDTLNILLADHLVPEKRRLEGELDDVRRARAQAEGSNKAEKRFAELQKLLDELGEFIDEVTRVAECGPPSTDSKTPAREVDARFLFDLDDGIQINCATLWSLLEPQWKDPKKLWQEIANAKGSKKDYSWAHATARYFPERTRAKCEGDASLSIAHGCLWEMHPSKAFAWELRQQDEFGPLQEHGADELRSKFLQEHAKEAVEIRASVAKRQERQSARDGELGNEPLLGRSS